MILIASLCDILQISIWNSISGRVQYKKHTSTRLRVLSGMDPSHSRSMHIDLFNHISRLKITVFYYDLKSSIHL